MLLLLLWLLIGIEGKNKVLALLQSQKFADSTFVQRCKEKFETVLSTDNVKFTSLFEKIFCIKEKSQLQQPSEFDKIEKEIDSYNKKVEVIRHNISIMYQSQSSSINRLFEKWTKSFIRKNLEIGFKTLIGGGEITTFSNNENKYIEFPVYNDPAASSTVIENIIREEGGNMELETFSELLMKRKCIVIVISEKIDVFCLY
jgi:hypothetical protein